VTRGVGQACTVGLISATDIDPRPRRTARQRSSIPTRIPAGQNGCIACRLTSSPGCAAWPRPNRQGAGRTTVTAQGSGAVAAGGPGPARSGCRNRAVAAARRWRARKRFVAADAVVVELGAGRPGFHPLVPKRPVGVLLAVAHGQLTPPPSTTRTVTLRHVRLVRVRRISAGNRSGRHKHRSTTQYRNPTASDPEFNFDSFRTFNQHSRLQPTIRLWMSRVAAAQLDEPFRRQADVQFVLIKRPALTHRSRNDPFFDSLRRGGLTRSTRR
jgi:hypothetical protein